MTYAVVFLSGVLAGAVTVIVLAALMIDGGDRE